ncbi:ABC transporter permease subunit [Rhodoplanes sp. TEM]|uniref:ABC transporter permease subunit n=1 Tax=Rhodoplanes tepidamans TaxID=200616 RepID=A0ABT5JDB0_RHOTP|nr:MULTISPECIES: ABC transporter permease subunit [Rhodoplanes]MDC7787622.1 ABC transporter permease subunit [Rhodoplanes tepidamans]MDC7984562.1 ABC transporter permease subunit [Rhodoplanes sp. TEM]MDQ0355191.1 putative spermidine/putrescine transport system permease protein [Rhodoplanes tepidamans]
MSEPARTPSRRARLWRRLDAWSYAAVLSTLGGAAMVLLALPTVIVLVTSFTSAATLRFPPPGFSTQWYRALVLASPEIVDAALVSLQVAAVATAAATVLATSAAIAIDASASRWARVADTMLMSPLLLPGLALALGLLLTFSLLDMRLSMTTLIIGHTVICCPFILRTTLASLAQIDRVLAECSSSLGAGALFTFAHVTFPLARGGIGAGAFIAFMASFDNVAISLFLADAHSEVLPIRLWDLIENLLDVRAAAASGVLIVTTIVLMVVMERLTGLSRYVR